MSEKKYASYIENLQKTKFSGDIQTDYASRLAVATDNSVYQVVPKAVIFPKNTQDISIALSLTTQEKFREIQFSPRGGGTATNGQSLSAGIIIDCSRHMCDILEINKNESYVHVQAGIVLDQLNASLKWHGMHFPPEISPSNRATLGGMINTDACGNGSKIIGRTSDHVIHLTCVLSNGQIIQTQESIYDKQLIELLEPKQNQIHEKFIERPRNLNGYNLLKMYQKNKINLNYLICGSEGTLAIVSEAVLKISPIPLYKKLVLIKYKNFDEALRAHSILEKFNPLVIEAIDETLLNLARSDAIYYSLKDILDSNTKAGAINLVEFVSEKEETLYHAIKILSESISQQDFYVAKNEMEMKLLWDLRKKSVGLISKSQQGTRRPIPFIEDTAVPPEKLADYICEFKKILDSHHLVYGMYGHVEAGCVHVRPALDLKQAQDEHLFKTLSDQIANLVEQMGGVMWGEHGMGFRSHYAKKFFGEELYFLVRQIKTLFDPDNHLNPGKIAVPLNHPDQLVDITGSFRADWDKQIPIESQADFESSITCNGNGACFNYASQEVMCPSYKVTRDRIHSPKGRASVVREWLRTDNKNFSHEVYAAMNGCLSCKACVTQCPLNVDIPDMKSRFLFSYHQDHFRPLRDYLVAVSEKIAKIQHNMPKLSNALLGNRLIQWGIKKIFKLVDIPLLNSASIETSMPKNFEDKAVILLQDAFTSFYEEGLILKVRDFLMSLNYKVYILPFFPNGKPLHVKGFLNRFSKIAKQNIRYLIKMNQLHIPILGIDPSMTLTYRDEYKKIAGSQAFGLHVKLLQEWLEEYVKSHTVTQHSVKTYYLLSHCTEKTACVAAEKQWQNIFAAFGLKLIPLAAGCCGMAGSYGHELEHQAYSKALFAMDWERYIRDNPDAAHTILATGYSCRSQVKRLKGIQLKHPIEVLT